MAAPSYTTDLTELAEANTTNDTGTWAELNGHTGGSAAGTETDYFIQGTSCISQQLGTKTGTQAGIQYDHGATVTLATDDVISFWTVLLAGNAIDTFTNGGMRAYLGSSAGNVKVFKINGSDFNRNPYGGWINVAVDPTNTGDYANEGSPSGTDWRLVGAGPNLTASVSKGYMHAIDRIMYGRCEIIVTDGDGTSGYATFDGMATENDYNDATNGYNRWGLFSLQGGSYLWKGLMSLGTTTSVDFRDANRNIVIDQTPKTYAAFNRIEINNTSSNIEWTAINITAPSDIPSGESSILSKGEFEMIDGATLAFDSCTFTDMSTFVFNKGTGICDIDNTTFRRCGKITSGGGSFDGCTIDDTADTVTAMTCSSPANAALISNSTFISGGTGHAIEITGTAANITLTGNVFTGYSTVTDANKAIYVNIASGSMTITVSGGSGLTASAVRTAGAIVTVNSDVTVTFTGLKDNSEVRVYKVSDDSVVGGTEDATTGTVDNRSFAWSAPASTEVYYRIHCFQPGDEIYETIYVPSYTVPSSDTSIPISQRLDRNAEN